MAGDWIRFRSELWSHPRFLALCRAAGAHLDAHVKAGAERYETVTNGYERALRAVTEPFTRDICMAALLRVWSAVNAHGKVDGDDAVCSPMTPGDLDHLAGFPGFAEALAAAGWVVADGHNSLRFPNFREHNDLACCRRAAKSDAERMREYRARKAREREELKKTNAVQKDPLRTVTNSYGREEKRREEKKTTSPDGEVVCPEVPEAAPSGPTEPPSPVAMTFPTVGGKAETWDLTEAHLAKYAEAWPNLDVRAAFVKARLWCENNPSRRKTPKGMPRFLQTWLERTTDRGRAAPAANGRPDAQGLLDYFKDV